MNLRARARADMKKLNTRDWGLLAIIKFSDGNICDTDAQTGEPLKSLQALSDITQFTPDSGEDMVVDTSVVVFARDSLSRVPRPGESCFLQIQFEPGGDLISKVMTDVRAPEGGASVGFINIFMQDVKQA